VSPQDVAQVVAVIAGFSHSRSFDQRRRPETLRTAMATAFFWPTRTTSRLPRVTAVYHARAKVFLDAFGRCGGRSLEEPGLELLPMGSIIRPVAGSRNPLAGGDHCGVADDGDEIAVAARFDPNDAKSVVGILVGDALNQPGQHLPIGLRLHLHDVHRTGLVARTLALGDEVLRDPAP
jgi:hypothetical protein